MSLGFDYEPGSVWDEEVRLPSLPSSASGSSDSYSITRPLPPRRPASARPYRATGQSPPPSPPPLPERQHDQTARTHHESRSKTTTRLLTKLLAREERSTQKLHSIYTITSNQLAQETNRADSLTSQLQTALGHIRTLTQTNRTLTLDVTRLSSELTLYKSQLDIAQKEILRAQAVVDELEQARKEAEEEAAKARSIARRFKEERLVDGAREEGRREGFRDGLERGRREGLRDARTAVEIGRRRFGRDIIVEEAYDDYAEEEEEQESPARAATPPPPPPRTPVPPPGVVYSAPRPPSSNRSRRPAPRVHIPDVAQIAPPLPRATLTTPLRLDSPHHAPPSPTPPPGQLFNQPQHPEVIRLRNNEQSPISPTHSRSHSIPPDGWIPHVDPDVDSSRPIPIPPPYRLSRPLSPTTSRRREMPEPIVFPNPEPSGVRVRDYAFRGTERDAYRPPPVGGAGDSSTTANLAPPFRPSSRTSTRVSDYDLVSPPRTSSETQRPERRRRGASVSEGVYDGGGSVSGRGSVGRTGPIGIYGPLSRIQTPQPQAQAQPPRPPPQVQVPAPPQPPVDRSSSRTPLDRVFRRLYRSRTSSSNGVPQITVEPPVSLFLSFLSIQLDWHSHNDCYAKRPSQP
ncbi:hypothetical protein JAAARDRAFT_637570 [Jaapia argillacea MUCL 33604]|uniref:Uncharacterized protein n=1 Tax=Jaapia argillacea MUCL 33604 TaxID=933084 RepID=A0A067Q1F8_9AGAM|nr:hypothetical protein JAAARDRAFT_637570 [Jaapia argillacea MUCL 33604]